MIANLSSTCGVFISTRWNPSSFRRNYELFSITLRSNIICYRSSTRLVSIWLCELVPTCCWILVFPSGHCFLETTKTRPHLEPAPLGEAWKRGLSRPGAWKREMARLKPWKRGMAKCKPWKRGMNRLELWEGGLDGNEQWKKEIVDKSRTQLSKIFQHTSWFSERSEEIWDF